jgi:hypothetical protein
MLDTNIFKLFFIFGIIIYFPYHAFSNEIPITSNYNLIIEQISDEIVGYNAPLPLTDLNIFSQKMKPWFSTCKKPFWYMNAPSNDDFKTLAKKTTLNITYEGFRRLRGINEKFSDYLVKKLYKKPLMITCKKPKDFVMASAFPGVGNGWIFPAFLNIGLMLASTYSINPWMEESSNSPEDLKRYRLNAITAIFHEMLHIAHADNKVFNHEPFPIKNGKLLYNDVIYSCADSVYVSDFLWRGDKWMKDCKTCALAKSAFPGILTRIDHSSTAVAEAEAKCLSLKPLFRELNPEAD